MCMAGTSFDNQSYTQYDAMQQKEILRNLLMRYGWGSSVAWCKSGTRTQDPPSKFKGRTRDPPKV